MITLAIRLPTASAKRLTDITPEHLKKMRVKAILLDIDNTLSHHDSHQPFDGVMEWIEKMNENGFKLMIVSNNKKERVTPFAAKLGLPFVWRACKPLPIGYIKACKLMKVRHHQAVIIGDQIYTDIVGANATGMKSILVEPAMLESGFSFKVRRHFETNVRKKLKEKKLTLK